MLGPDFFGTGQFTCDRCKTHYNDDFYYYYDEHWQQDLCEDCFNARWEEELKAKNLEWFEDNLNPDDERLLKIKQQLKEK